MVALAYEVDTEKFFQLSLDMLCIAGMDGYFKFLNPAFQSVLGWKNSDLLEKPFIDFVHPDDVNKTLSELKNLSGGNLTISFGNRYRRVDGSYRHLLWTARPELETGLLYAVAKDVTELRQSQNRFVQMLESAPSAMLMINPQGEIAILNREAERLFGYPKDELLGAPLVQLLPERIKQDHERFCGDFFKEQIARPMGTGRDLTGVKKDGSFVPVEIGLTPVEIDEGSYVICAVIDLTVRKKTEADMQNQVQSLEQLANVDALTGLLNRRAFFDQLHLQIRISQRAGGPVSLLMFDVDKFKLVNDTYGHQEGDQVLRKMAELAKTICRDSDVAGRYGGEEFALMLPATGSKGAIMAAEKCRARIEHFDWPIGTVTASFGAASAEPSSKPKNSAEYIADELVKQADQALYRSKKTGRNRSTHFVDIPD